MDELIIYMREFGEIGSAAEELIRAHACEMTLGRHDIILEEGEIPSRIGYLVSGVLAAIRSNVRGDEVISWFVEDRAFATGFGDYYQQVPSRVRLEAIIESRIVFINDVALSKVGRSVQRWDEIVRKLSQHDLIATVTKRMGIVGEDPRTRYLEFELRYPGLVERIPQSMISNYLGIAPATISRIRKRMRSNVDASIT